MDFGIRGVSSKSSFLRPFPDLAKASQIAEAFGHVEPHVVIEKDERRLPRLLRLPARHAEASSAPGFEKAQGIYPICIEGGPAISSMDHNIYTLVPGNPSGGFERFDLCHSHLGRAPTSFRFYRPFLSVWHDMLILAHAVLPLGYASWLSNTTASGRSQTPGFPGRRSHGPGRGTAGSPRSSSRCRGPGGSSPGRRSRPA
jgi:hypothetical protein